MKGSIKAALLDAVIEGIDERGSEAVGKAIMGATRAFIAGLILVLIFVANLFLPHEVAALRSMERGVAAAVRAVGGEEPEGQEGKRMQDTRDPLLPGG